MLSRVCLSCFQPMAHIPPYHRFLNSGLHHLSPGCGLSLAPLPLLSLLFQPIFQHRSLSGLPSVQSDHALLSAAPAPRPPPSGLVPSGSSPALRPGLQDLCFLILRIPASNPIMAHISLSLSSCRDCSLCLELAPFARSQSVRAAITTYHKLGNLNSRHFFLTVVEAGSLGSGRWHGWVLVRALFLVCRQPPSCYILL